MIIASLTTLPNRITRIKNALDSIVDQVDSIEINIPYKCKRTNEDYIIPEWLESYPKLTIFREEDIGPLTKIVPTLKRHQDKYIISIDDDVNYTPTIVQDLKRACGINQVSSASGILINNKTYSQSKSCNVSALEGFAGIMYPPRIYQNFEYFEKTNTNIDCYLSDDVILSNWLVNQGLRLYMVSCPVPKQFAFGLVDRKALHSQNNMKQRYIRVVNWLKENKMLYIRIYNIYNRH